MASGRVCVATNSYIGSDLEVLANMPNYYSWIMDMLEPFVRGSVVEYGAGLGTFSERLRQRAADLTLVEPSHNLIDRLQNRFAGFSGVRTINTSLESHVASLPDESVDTFVLINVLEHIEDDKDALRRLLTALRPSGHLLVFVPALPFLMSKLDRSLGHFRRYMRDDLVSKVGAAGGAVEMCRYVDVFGTLPWFLLNTLLGAMSFDPLLVQLNDRYVVPASRRFEGLLPPRFGKNLILVARKP